MVQAGLLLLGELSALQPLQRPDPERQLPQSHRRGHPLGSPASGEPLLSELPALHQIPQVCLCVFVFVQHFSSYYSNEGV